MKVIDTALDVGALVLIIVSPNCGSHIFNNSTIIIYASLTLTAHLVKAVIEALAE